MVEGKCRGDLGASASVEVWASGGPSPVFELTEHVVLALLRFPAVPSRSAFPRPSRWAWKVEICCSRDRKLSCTLSNCRQRGVFVCLFVYLAAFPFTCSMLAWSSSSGHTDSPPLQLPPAWLLMWVWLQVSSCSGGDRADLAALSPPARKTAEGSAVTEQRLPATAGCRRSDGSGSTRVSSRSDT